MYVYADNAATTAMSETALEAMLPCLREAYANPSSLHTPGQRAAEKLAQAREVFARNLGASPSEITFTSGGSESDNQALRSGAMLGLRKGKKHIISTKFEHHAVLHTLQALEKEGFEVTLLDIPPDGVVTAEQVRQAIRPDTALVSVMFANNEIGTIEPIAEIGKLAHEKGIYFHTDAVQAMGHVPIDVEEMHIDLLSISGHKLGAPKGIGAIYIRKGVRITPLIFGGAQEKKMRAGTENIPGIVGLGKAVELASAELPETRATLEKMRDRLIHGILEAIPYSKLNGHPTDRLPGNCNISFEFIEGESMLLLLDALGVAASSGSACTSGSLDPSHVLLAIGLPHEKAHGSLRLTLDTDNTEEEIDFILEKLPQIVARLREMSPLYEEISKQAK